MVTEMISIAADVAPGMSMGEVLDRLGTPTKAESFRVADGEYSLWVFASDAGREVRIVCFGADRRVRSTLE
jgi:hypothetical protein